MTECDVAIIGSGPISLFEAIHQAKKGKSVLIIEEKSRLGGAWSSIEYEPGHRYEIGCHIWDVNKTTYGFIEDYLGEELHPILPPPIVVWRDMKMPYDWKNNILALRLLLRKPKQFFSSNRKVRMRIIPRNYCYPKGGSEQLIERLLDDAKRLNVRVSQDSPVSSIEVHSNFLRLIIGDRKVETKEMVCTSFSSFPEVIVGEKVMGTSRKEEDFWHFQFVVEGNEARRMSYARILGHPFIHRVSDISSISKGRHQVFSIGVFTNLTTSMGRAEVATMIEKALRNWKWISPEAQVIENFDNRYRMKRPDLAQREALIQSGMVTFIQSTNFSYAIAQNAQRWASS